MRGYSHGDKIIQARRKSIIFSEIKTYDSVSLFPDGHPLLPPSAIIPVVGDFQIGGCPNGHEGDGEPGLETEPAFGAEVVEVGRDRRVFIEVGGGERRDEVVVVTSLCKKSSRVFQSVHLHILLFRDVVDSLLSECWSAKGQGGDRQNRSIGRSHGRSKGNYSPQNVFMEGTVNVI